MAPEGLLIDWGGVLISNVIASFDAYCATVGRPPGTINETFRTDPVAAELLADLECGRLSLADFELRLAELLDLPADGFVNALFAASLVDDVMQNAVMTLRQNGVRTGLLSNSWGGARYDRSHWNAMFDVLVISGDVGVRKPDRAIYELAVTAMRLPASALVFVDDLGGNLREPREMGMTTIKHLSTPSTLEQLEELFGVELLSSRQQT